MIIGPSGSGKDTLINGAKLLLNDEKRYVFAQREITRPQTGDSENHIEISKSEFKQKKLKMILLASLVSFCFISDFSSNLLFFL